jgi:23S rRNA pseudouridine1911/1915/1917 synthase
MDPEDEPLELPTRPPGVGEDYIVRVLRVPPESAGMRLDRFLSHELRQTSRTRARAIARASAYSWEGRSMRASERLRAEARIVLWRAPLDEAAPPTPVRTLYEDAYLLVVDKPPLMTVHPTARHHTQTVIKTLERQRPGQYLSLIHRLDRETSGVLLVAKTKEADRAFKMRLEERSIAGARAAERGEPPGAFDKSYLGLTWGIPQLGLRSEPLEDDPSPVRVKMRVAAKGTGLAARTGVQVLATSGSYALCRLDLYTGRQHQIRVHLAHGGTPIVGDKLYGPDERLLTRAADGELTEDDERLLELPRHALHAWEHRVTHPMTGEELCLRAPFPADLSAFWQGLGGALPAGLDRAGPG